MSPPIPLTPPSQNNQTMSILLLPCKQGMAKQDKETPNERQEGE